MAGDFDELRTRERRADMTQELWTEVDDYINESLVPGDAALENAVKKSSEAGLPQIQVSPSQGKLLHLLARTIGARRILEIGTLGGYSTIWLARALPPDGKLITLEASPKHAEVAQSYIAFAGLADKVELRLGPALETLPKLAAEKPAPFDFIFIDADKKSMPEYFDWALKLSRKGSLIFSDNVVRSGGIVDAGSADPDIQGVRRFYQVLHSEPRVCVTAVQTVGSKGYDGYALALVT
jgi:predicted O-methyltransferase YrrM